jgi:perosamine synthetase
MIKIPVYEPFLNGNEKKYVNDCLDSTWISSKGKYINLFEDAFSKYIGAKYSASVCNGTVALHVALLALGIGENDEVIVPTLTYIASVNAISYTGAKPVFVDSEYDTWQISPTDVTRKITSKTKAILAVHLYGHPCEMHTLQAICKEHNLFLIEDCAEAIGALYNNKHVGTFGDISTFSFFGNKTITTGEGGMVVTNDETLHDRVVHFKGQGLAMHRQYWHDVIGYNYRMTNICAAIGLAQLEEINTIIEKKLLIAKYYKEGIKSLPLSFHEEYGDVRHSYWMCSVVVENPEQRDQLRSHLESFNIETRPVFYPVHTMPMYSQKFERHVNAEKIGWRGLNLPSFPSLTKENQNFIIDTIKDFYNEAH